MAEKMAKTAGKILAFVFCLGLSLAVIDEGFRITRGWLNKNGAVAEGFGVYERDERAYYTDSFLGQLKDTTDKTRLAIRKEYGLPESDRQEWELMNFYQWKWWC